MDAENRKPQLEDIDRWLDFALRERANAEPRSGLEERVLARLVAQPPRQAFAWWQVWVAAAAIFLIVLSLTVIYPRRPKQVAHGPGHPLQPGTQADKLTPDPRLNATQPRGASGRDAACCVSTRMLAKNTPRSAVGRSAVRTQPEPLPKLATFPAPRPETTQERLLARLAAQKDLVEVAGLSNDGMPLKELSIPELKIDPVERTPSDEVRRDEFGRKDASQEHE